MAKPLIKCVSWYLITAMFIIGISSKAYAGLCPSEAIALSQFDRTVDIHSIKKILERKMIRKRLDALGFSQDEIQARLNRLNSQQLHRLALNLDEIKTGAGGFEVLVVVLLIGIVVALWLQVTGKRVIVQNR